MAAIPNMAMGWSREPVRPSKIPQSGPAAEAERGVIIMAAVAIAAARPSKFDEDEDSLSDEERLSGSNDSTVSNSFSKAARLVTPREESVDVGTVKPVTALVARVARTI